VNRSCNTIEPPENSIFVTRLHSAADAKRWCQHEFDSLKQAFDQHDKLAGLLHDQMAPERLIHLLPAMPQHNPLLLIGGMGPLAGLRSTLQALEHVGDSREMILFQACKIPCRSQATLAHLVNDHKPWTAVVESLLHALLTALGITTQKQNVDLVVLCNTAHYFLPSSLAQLNSTKLNFHSLIDAGVEAARIAQPKNLLTMTSAGTHSSGLYSKPLNTAKVLQITTSEFQQTLLNHAIIDGVKGGNPQAALHWGSEFFSALRQNLPDVLLAGCTEIPALIELLQKNAKPWLRSYLCQTPLLDPVEEVMLRLIK